MSQDTELVARKHAERMRKHRQTWGEEQKQRNREQSKLRMQKYRGKKCNDKGKNEPGPRKTRLDMKKEEERKAKAAAYRREYRANLSAQKKRRIREKDAARKQLQRQNNKEKNSYTKRNSVVSACSDQASVPGVMSSRALNQAKQRLPKFPTKYAEDVSDLCQNVTPKRKEALKKGISNTGAKKTLGNLLGVIKEADIGMRGKDKAIRTKSKSFIGALAGTIKKKYSMMNTFCKAAGIHRKYLSKGCSQKQKKRKDSLDKNVLKPITDFFQQDDISVNLPKKRNIKKDLQDNRVLQRTLDSTWIKWKTDNPDMTVSFDKFGKLKPKFVKTQKNRKLFQCRCEYCENSRLKLSALNKIADENNQQDLKRKTIHEALESTLCPKTSKFNLLPCVDRLCKDCGTSKLRKDLLAKLPESEQEWKKWCIHTTKNKRTGKEMKKKQLATIKGKSSQLIEEFVRELEFLSVHLFEAHWQIAEFGKLTKHVPQKTVALTIDFAENYSCFSQDEVQSAHWSKESVTIHPSIVYYQCPNCPGEQIIEEACDIISDDLVHDSHAVNAFLNKIFCHLKDQRGLVIRKAYVMSDACAAQYKSNIPFADTANSMSEFGFPMQRDYYGSRHGKSRCDKEGGVLKSRITRAVKNKEAEIATAEDFYQFCKDNLEKKSYDTDGKCLHQRRQIIFVPTEDIQRQRPGRLVKTVPGIQELHSVMGVGREVLKLRRLSCFCFKCLSEQPEECTQKIYVGAWKPIRLKYLHDVDAQPSHSSDTALNVQSAGTPCDIQHHDTVYPRYP